MRNKPITNIIYLQVDIAMLLVKDHMQDGETIAILTYYRAQHSQISQYLQSRHDPQRNDVDVSTVVMAQGI